MGKTTKKQTKKPKPGPKKAEKMSEAHRAPDFDELVLEHIDMLYAVAMKLTRNVTDAQDLTQNTVLKAFRFHSKFKKGTYIKAWLLTILRNTFINDYRRRVRFPLFVELSGYEQSPDPSPDPAVRYDPKGTTYSDVFELLDDSVIAAIESLPDDFRLAVIMADIEDKSYKEIAQVMQCPLGTVMSRLYRGRKLLRKQLGDYARDQGIANSSAATYPRSPNAYRITSTSSRITETAQLISSTVAHLPSHEPIVPAARRGIR